jgi:uncharacterized membrane protein (DUF485 family)
MKVRFAKKAMAFAIVGLAVLAGFVQIVLMLWNWLMPAIFGLATITFLQALGLMVLSWILFGGFSRMGPRKRFTSEMTPEERAKFREGLLSRCGRGGAPAE